MAVVDVECCNNSSYLICYINSKLENSSLKYFLQISERSLHCSEYHMVLFWPYLSLQAQFASSALITCLVECTFTVCLAPVDQLFYSSAVKLHLKSFVIQLLLLLGKYILSLPAEHEKLIFPGKGLPSTGKTRKYSVTGELCIFLFNLPVGWSLSPRQTLPETLFSHLICSSQLPPRTQFS